MYFVGRGLSVYYEDMKGSKAFLVFALATVIVASTPFTVQAQTAEQLRSQISQILAEIYALRAQLQPGIVSPNIPVVPLVTQVTPPTLVTPRINYNGNQLAFQYQRCPNAQFNLERGDRDRNVGGEVTAIQQFLAQDSRLYPEGDVTGYFGPATERAIQRFQERHGIVSAGDYQSTGYGRVGPQTRWAIKNSCGVAGTNSFSISPTAGLAPLQISATFEFRGSSCTSYQLDWGDGSAPLAQQAVSPANCSNDTVRKQATHTYTSAGVYAPTLRIGKGSVYAIPIVGRANITVQGVGSGTASQASLVVSPAQGNNVPLVVQATLRSNTPSSCTSYELDWGDGTQPIRREASGFGCTVLDSFTQQFTHTYQNVGVYKLRARAGRGQIPGLAVINQLVTVGTGTAGTFPTNAGCFVQPSNNGIFGAAQARILFGGSLCDGQLTYNVDWGDGTVSPSQICADQNAHYEQLIHTYSIPGTYTARLNQLHPNARFAEQTCSVVISSRGSAAPGIIIPTRDSINWTKDQSSRTVEFTALINATRECNGGLYTIYFGDGSDSLQPYPADACQLFTRTVSHTYARDGLYTALLLKDGIVVDQAALRITRPTSAAQQNLASAFSAIKSLIQVIFK